MLLIDKTREVSLLSASSNNCSYHQSNKQVNLCFSEISIDENHFQTNDFVLIESSGDVEVARLICMYLSYEETTAAVVRKYVFARTLKSCFSKHGYQMDEKNEVVEDVSRNYIIDLQQIIKKCQLVLLLETDQPDYIATNALDPETNFSLRFSLKSNRLYPILSEQSILSETSLNSPKSSCTRVQSPKMGSENTPLSQAVDKKPPSTVRNDIVSPPRRNSVKRNLNKSFGDSPQDNNNSILNYSVVNITDDENDKPLVMKLRVSTRSRSTSVSKHEGSASPQAVRKSKRNSTRPSYADYISPQKTTPVKRQHSKSTSSSEEDEYSPSKNKLCKNTPTTRRVVNGSARKTTQSVSSKRKTSVPQRFRDDSNPSSARVTPARRSLRFVQDNCDSSSPTRSVRSSRCHRISYNEDDLTSVAQVNLDDSMRTRILKIKLNRKEVEIEIDNKPDDNCPSDEFSQSTSTSTEEADVEESPTPITPPSKRKSKKYATSSDEEESEFKISTPKKNRKKHSTPKKVSTTPKSSEAKTPRSAKKQTPRSKPKTPKTPAGNRMKLIREGVVTPSMHARIEKVTGDSTPLMRARSQLHVSYVPDSLPCREKEYCDVYNFIEGKLFDKCGGCMYISGVPGTGKTATVTSVIDSLSNNRDVPKFTFVNINGMRLTEPRQSYVEILKQLTGKTVPWEQAQSTLEEIFIKSKKSKPVVMLIDELDILCTKRQDVVYNLLDWPTKAKNQLIVITIANTMDLPERLLMSRVTSRLGLTRLTFQAYTHKQLQEIVTKRLFGTDSFNPDAVQFVARKVASVSGDARRALDICRRAAEIAEREEKTQMVGMSHVNEALNAMITQPKIRAIKSCSRLEQLIMQSIVAEVERTGVEETTFLDMFKMLDTCAAIDGFRRVSITVATRAVSRLSSCRLLLNDQKCNDIHQKIILNVSIDDVHYALKRD